MGTALPKAIPAALVPGDHPPAASAEAWAARHVPPPFDLTPFTRAELYRWFKGGEATGDRCEKLLAWGSRALGGLNLNLADGFHALQQGGRLAELGFHLDDYARERLDMGKRCAETLALLGRELQSRPLLREALLRPGSPPRSGDRPQARPGRGEAGWVERAATMTVRQLEEAVKKAGVDPAAEEEAWFRLVTLVRPIEQALVDGAVGLAGRVLPESGRLERLEAIAQEFLAEHPGDSEADATRKLGRTFKAVGDGSAAARQAALEAETDRWGALPPVADWPAPEPRFFETATAQALVVRQAHHERSTGRSPCACRRASRAACKLEGEKERQMRAQRQLSVPLPRRVAVLFQAAFERIRELSGQAYSAGKCLGILSWHFLTTWDAAAERSRTSSQRVRERDGEHCTVPGCSHRGGHAHHVEYRSHALRQAQMR
jgi:hypothetical protein